MDLYETGQVNRHILDGAFPDRDREYIPTDADLLNIGREVYNDNLMQRKHQDRVAQRGSLMYDIRRLYNGWKDNSLTRTQPFTLTLDAEKIELLLEIWDSMNGPQAQQMNPVDRVLSRPRDLAGAYGTTQRAPQG